MAIPYTRINITSGTASASNINTNFQRIETALQNALSRAGSTPNSMSATLDMNSNSIINLPDAVEGTSPVTFDQLRGYADSLVFTGVLSERATAATNGQTLVTLSTYTYDTVTDSIAVFINGVYQAPSQYAKTSSSSITLTNSLQAGDVVDFAIFAFDDTAETVPSTLVQYAPTPAEVSASVAITNSNYLPGDVRRYGAESGALDSTTAFQAAALVASTHENYWPAGIWNISSVTFGDNAKIRTDGFSTKVNQLAGYDGTPNTQARLVNLAGSNITLGSFQSTGQIATDSDEQQHVCFVYKTGASIKNITIGDIKGTDIRGDVLYIGAPAGQRTDNVSFGRITGTNIYRNVVSIVGGVSVTGISAIADGAVGLSVLDVEPDNDPSTDIHVELVKGRFCQVAPPNSADYADRVSIGHLDLQPSYSANSTPNYPLHVSSYGLSTRNCRMVQIKNARIKDFTHHAIFQTFNVGELADQRFHIGHLEVSGCGSGESTFNSPIVVANVTYFKLDSGLVSLQAVGDYCFYGDATLTKTRFDISNFECDGTVVRFAKNSRFSGVKINTTNDVNAFRDLDNCVIQDSDITIPRLGSNVVNTTFINVDATCSTSYISGTSSGISFINCSGGLEPVSSPAQITANQNDYAVAQGVQTLRLTTDASRNITGITNGLKGRTLRVINVGAQDIVLTNEDAASTAANRLALAANITLNAAEGLTLEYDSTSSRWRCVGRSN